MCAKGSGWRVRMRVDLSEAVQAWVLRSCKEQGVPVHIADPTTLRRVVSIVCAAQCAAPASVRTAVCEQARTVTRRSASTVRPGSVSKGWGRCGDRGGRAS
jgi:hypothetical protein